MPTRYAYASPKETTIGYLPQQMQLTDSRTVREEAEQAFGHIQEMEKEIERLNLELAERTDYETESYQKLIDKVTHLSEHFQLMGGSNYHAELERTLIGLGFNRSDFERPTSEFSGGWRMRIELAKLLLRRPDVLRLFTNSTAIGQLHLLRQIADRRLFGNTHRTGCRRLQTCKYLQHRRFSRPVLTDQCDTILLVYHKRNIIKKRKSAKFNC